MDLQFVYESLLPIIVPKYLAIWEVNNTLVDDGAFWMLKYSETWNSGPS
jgi:hypothetical protein